MQQAFKAGSRLMIQIHRCELLLQGVAANSSHKVSPIPPAGGPEGFKLNADGFSTQGLPANLWESSGYSQELGHDKSIAA